MKKKIYILGMLLLLTACTTQIQVEPTIHTNEVNEPTVFLQDRILQIGAWNVQVLGDAKVSKEPVLDKIIEEANKYDIIVIQEIRDKDGSAWSTVCSQLQHHQCIESSRAGRSKSKEQIGIAYSNTINLLSTIDYNPDALNRWERPPFKAIFAVGNYTVALYTTHIDPDSVREEFKYLEELVLQEDHQGNTIVLGDFNLDCDYFDENNIGLYFQNWTYAIPNEYDTTVAQSACTYDRIILNSDAAKEAVAAGVYAKGITKNVSDHYIVWTALDPTLEVQE